jgi:hypothetical protein
VTAQESSAKHDEVLWLAQDVEGLECRITPDFQEGWRLAEEIASRRFPPVALLRRFVNGKAVGWTPVEPPPSDHDHRN